jgi:hypothetical protein
MLSLPRMTGALGGAAAAALLLITISETGVLAQQAIVVESAIPAVAAQATVNLNVSIKGKGFKRGARAQFLVAGTDDPGGVTVNATAYVSSSEVIANIDVDANAALATFDIEIANDDDRTGKGTELFAVVSGGNGAAQAQCVPQSLAGAPGFVLANQLNGADANELPTYGARFGVNVKATPFEGVLLLAVGTRNTYDVSRIEIFHIAADGARVDGTGMQDHQTLIAPINDFGPNGLAWGDVDHNGAPDLVAVSTVSAAGFVFLGSVDGVGELTFSPAMPLPKGGRSRYGASVVVADFDGNALNGDEIAVGSIGGGSGKSAEQPTIQLYGYSGGSFTIRRTVTPSGLKNDDSYGWTIASGDVDNDGDIDLAVGAQNRDVNNVTDAGAVYLHYGPLLNASAPHPLLATAVLTAANLVKNEMFGQDVAIGNLNNDLPLDIVSGAETRALIFTGNNGSNAAPTLSSDLTPEGGLEGGWPGRDILIANLSPTAPRPDVVIGAPNASRLNACNSPGVTYAFVGTGTSGFVRHRLEAETDNGGFAAFGWSVAGIDGFPVLAVGEHHRRINGIEAGQVYLYLVP